MTLGLVLFFLILIILLGLVFLPLRSSSKILFPENPRPKDLRAELQMLTERLAEAEGEDRKAILSQMVRLENELNQFGNPLAAPIKIPAVVIAVISVLVLALGAGLWKSTVPRLPGETVVAQRKEAKRLGELEQMATKTNSIKDWMAYSDLAYDLQDFERAGQGYLKVLDQDKSNNPALRRLGMLLFMSGLPDQAIPVLQIATAKEPKVPEGWLFLGNSYFQKDQPTQAISAWENYLKNGGESKERVTQLIDTARAQVNAPPQTGRSVFLKSCAGCHGAGATGGVGPALKGNPVSKVPEAVAEIVRSGRGAMPAVSLSEKDLSVLLDYLGSL